MAFGDQQRFNDIRHRGLPLRPRQEVNEFAKRRKPDRDVREVIATRENLYDRLKAFTEVGASKFVIVPLEEPDDWTAELEDMAERVLPLEN